MTEVEELKKEIIERYNMTWDELEEDHLGLFQETKENFKRLIDRLVELARLEGLKKIWLSEEKHLNLHKN